MWWLALAALAQDPHAIEGPSLLPGDPAPAIEAAAWLRGGPVVPGASGRATLVEFTATWCGPCAAFLPKLLTIARDHGDRLDVVAVHVWEQDLPQVEAFVAGHGPDALPPNVGYAPSGGAYAQATWMDAAGRDGIPTVFLVASDGTLAWIGYPESGLDRALSGVLDGTWDPQAERAVYQRVQRREALHSKWIPRLTGPDRKTLPADQALAVLDDALAEDPDTRYALATFWFDAWYEVDPPLALAYAAELTHHTDEVSGHHLNAIAWELATAPDRVGADPAVARILAEAANQRYEWADPNMLDTLARVLWLQDDLDGAIALQEQAVAKSADDATLRWTEKTLKWYRKQAAKAAATR